MEVDFLSSHKVCKFNNFLLVIVLICEALLGFFLYQCVRMGLDREDPQLLVLALFLGVLMSAGVIFSSSKVVLTSSSIEHRFLGFTRKKILLAKLTKVEIRVTRDKNQTQYFNFYQDGDRQPYKITDFYDMLDPLVETLDHSGTELLDHRSKK